MREDFLRRKFHLEAEPRQELLKLHGLKGFPEGVSASRLVPEEAPEIFPPKALRRKLQGRPPGPAGVNCPLPGVQPPVQLMQQAAVPGEK